MQSTTFGSSRVAVIYTLHTDGAPCASDVSGVGRCLRFVASPPKVMYTNVINTAFEGITRITDAVALLEIFYTLARRDAIKQTCLKKTAYTYMLFVR